MSRLLALLFTAVSLFAGEGSDPIAQALDRMYRLQFPAAHELLNRYIAGHPSDPLGYSMRAAAYLFSELDRLRILEGEFFANDKRIIERKGMKPDPAIRTAFYQTIQKARELAATQLAQKPRDENALFASCLAAGLQGDYMALVEKRQLASLTYAKEAQSHAVKLLDGNSRFYDAYLTMGITEYLLGSVPFFVKWFVRFEKAEGSKSVAVRNLEMVAKQGRYFGPFARVLLSIVHMREKRPDLAEMYLSGLAREYPENPLYPHELKRLRERQALVK